MSIHPGYVGGPPLARADQRPRRVVRRICVASLAIICTALAACSPQPEPGLVPPPEVIAPPPTDFVPLADDALGSGKPLGTGANDFFTGLAVSGDMVVAAGIVYGDRLAPAFRYSTDGGATWELGRLSETAEQAPPDQGDQTEDVAVATVNGATRWVAIGSDWKRELTWTSDDGRTWDRHEPKPDQIAENANVELITAVPDGFVMVGTDARDKPTAWTSADGIDWQPRRMGGAGAPAAVASKGSTVVAVGEYEDSYATWFSTDRGTTWQRGDKPPKPGDDDNFSRSLAGLTTTEDGFLAIGSYSAKVWQPVTYSSKNGRSWRLDSVAMGSAPTSDRFGRAVGSGGGHDLAVTEDYEPRSRPQIWLRTGLDWTRARTPLDRKSRLAEGDWSFGKLVRVGESWLATMHLSRNGQVVGELWRSTDGGRTFVTVPRPDAELNQPTTSAFWPLRFGQDTLVFGDSRRRPVVWTRTGTEPFGPAALISKRSSDRVEGAAAGPGRLLTWGVRDAAGVSAAIVWRQEGDRWIATQAGTFSRAKRRYASSSVAQVAWLRGRWVAVGETSDNGDINDSALVATSTDGIQWTKGRAARRFAKAGGDVWYDVTDLQGDHDRRRAMHGVAQVGKRLIAVGDSAEGKSSAGKGTAATVWTSDDARTWTMRRLPLGGLYRSSMARVVVRGSTVIVVGIGAERDGAPDRLVLWHSTNGGKTFRQQLLDPSLDTDVPELVALKSGFALVSSRIEQTSRPVLLLSEDGASWRERPVSAVSLSPGEGAGPAGVLADGDDLWLLIRTTNSVGAGTRLVVQSTR